MAAPVDIARTWTRAELAGLPDDGLRYELVDGGLVVTPPPRQRHQLRAGALAALLRASAPTGWRVLTEVPLPLGDQDLRVPDVMAFRWPLRHPTGDRSDPLGVADVGLVAEVVSPRTRKTDRFTKPGEYADAGLAHYWRLETDPVLTLHCFVLRDGAYVPSGTTTPWGEVVVDLLALDA